VVVYLPTNFEKDWPTLLPDCFAWFSHRQALNLTMSQHFFIPECCILSEEAANTHFIGKLG
jgi:hypothetical protein